MKHAKLSASGSHRWMTCPGSVNAEATMPRGESSVYANEGSCAHEVADKCLTHETDASEYLGEEYFETAVDEEMVMYVQEYVDYVRAHVTHKKDVLYPEKRVDFSHIVPEGFGTSDAIVIKADGSIHVFDLKYGKGVRVDAEGNTQALLYCSGARNDYEDEDEPFESFTMHIHQPRLNHITSWEINRGELIAFELKAKKAAKKALKPDAKRKPEEKACHWCSFRAKCPELKEKIEEELMVEFDDLNGLTVEGLTTYEIASVLKVKPLLDLYLKAAEAYVFNELLSGKEVEGFKLVEARKMKKWNDDAEEAIKGLIGEEAFEKKLKAIGKIEKLIGKDVVSQWTYKPEGEPVLAPESDKRKALDRSDMFED